MRRLITLIAIVLGCSAMLEAKCGVLFIAVQGDSGSAAKQQEVVVQVYPAHSNKYSEDKVTPNEGRFRADVTFSTFHSASLFGSHNCSRRPARVVVILMQNGSEHGRLEFSIPNDFTWDENSGRWTIKHPIVFNDHGTPNH